MKKTKKVDLLPGDPCGKRICEIFGKYPWETIQANAPKDPSSKPNWFTKKGYPERSRVLWQSWQDPKTLIGVRFSKETCYGLIDIDCGSKYLNAEDVDGIKAGLETIGIVRTLTISSSWSQGIHLYTPFPDSVGTFNLAVTLEQALVAQGFEIKDGQLEIFPNPKTFGSTIFIEYKAHRLPLQPKSGSFILDDDLNPVSDNLPRFLELWDQAAQSQNMDELAQALAIARDNKLKHPKRHKKGVKAQEWEANLKTEIDEGWTAFGQTNQLLKSMCCYGLVFKGLSGKDLVDDVLRMVVNSPGYEEFCRHQHEIERRIRAWTNSVEKFYYPYGQWEQAKRLQSAEEKVPSNQLKAKEAQNRIREAVKVLQQLKIFPRTANARKKALVSQGGVSSKTLYKNRELWHPDYLQSSEECKPLEKSGVSEALRENPAQIDFSKP